jgi:tripartite-type tricarboxylate transporter receptor subunit TctC
MHALQRFCLICVGIMISSVAWAAEYPAGPIRMVVGFPPGGGTDGAARIIAEKLPQQLGQAVVVENHAGAGGTIGANQVARATPDGYTVFFGSGAELMIAPITRKAVPYKLLKDFTPIGEVGSVKFVLVVPASSPVNDVKALVAQGKKHPGEMNFASFGVGSTNHMIGEMFLSSAGIQATHVPYQGSSPQITALLSGEVDFTFETAAVALPLIKSGKVKVLATSSSQRLKELPDVPTLQELGFTELVADGWMGLFAPANTPVPIVQHLNQALTSVLASPEVTEKLSTRGIVVQPVTPDQYRRKLELEMKRWQRVAEAADVSLE